ncbi:11876_t:CDS:2, partial [Funneliformis caledonium]
KKFSEFTELVVDLDFQFAMWVKKKFGSQVPIIAAPNIQFTAASQFGLVPKLYKIER